MAIKLMPVGLYSTPLMEHKPRLLNKIRLKHYSIRTEQANIDRIKRFIPFHHKRRPATIGTPEVNAFLSHLAVERQVAASTQGQALSALIFFYREILAHDLRWQEERARKPAR